MNTEFVARLLSRLRELPFRRRVSPLAAGAVACLLLVVGLTALSRIFSVTCAPDAQCLTLQELQDGEALPEALRIYDREGGLIAEVAGPLRRALETEEIPDLVADAFVAVEDKRFRSHQGVDARGIGRAVLANLRDGGISEGASTIPMQLVRTLWSESLREVGPWRRKIIEARTAPQLVEKLGHDRVLTLYLNAIYLGNGIYGVERASQYYFGRSVDELDLGQVATLVGMTRSPEYYEPRGNPERATAVRAVVLGLLTQAEVIDAEQAAEAAARDLGVVEIDPDAPGGRTRTHLTAAVTRELRRIAPDLSGRAGLSIHTTIDAGAQREAEVALETQLAAIEAGRYGTFAADSTNHLEGAAVALDPMTAAVRAWVGGRDFAMSEFDRVDQASRQVGSLVKPFLVALALEEGYGIVDMVSADTVPIATDRGPWLPADHVIETQMPLREALVQSSNRAAAHLGVTLGLGNVSAVGARVGLSGPIPSLPASTIGAFDASLLEMTSAYMVFGNGGRLAEPYLLTRIESLGGKELWVRDDSLEAEQVLDEATAYVVLDAMRAVVDRGTGTSVRGFGYRGPAAGKTGTTNDGRDNWFVGLTPDVVAGVWIGFDTPRSVVDNRGGGALAAPAWANWMKNLGGVVGDDGTTRRRTWIPPLTVERVRYDVATGQVIGPHCRNDPDGVYQDAWVEVGLYARECPKGGVRGWLDRVWKTLVPGDPQPVVRPVRGGQNQDPG